MDNWPLNIWTFGVGAKQPTNATLLKQKSPFDTEFRHFLNNLVCHMEFLRTNNFHMFHVPCCQPNICTWSNETLAVG